MPTDLEQLETIKAQTLALIADITANPKPSYRIDGQTVNWSDYLSRLRSTVDWCTRNIAGHQPFEVQSQAYT
jgi:hypothetical protein